MMSNIKGRTTTQQQIIAQIEINILFETKRERKIKTLLYKYTK